MEQSARRKGFDEQFSDIADLISDQSSPNRLSGRSVVTPDIKNSFGEVLCPEHDNTLLIAYPR